MFRAGICCVSFEGVELGAGSFLSYRVGCADWTGLLDTNYIRR